MEDFAAHGPLVRLVLPPIRFLFVGSRVCSTLPSDGPSRDLICPCASLALRLHQAVQGTFTPKLLNMPDTPCRRPFWGTAGTAPGEVQKFLRDISRLVDTPRATRVQGSRNREAFLGDASQVVVSS